MLVAPGDQSSGIKLARIVADWQVECGNRLRQQRVVGGANASSGVVLAGAFAFELAQLDAAIADVDRHQIRKYSPFTHASYFRQLGPLPVARGGSGAA